jgi:glyoxylase-like metal-dependent hydrolase (beta-lactamase superfamily II)
MTPTSPRPNPDSAPELHEVAPGVYAYVQPDGGWMINNTGFVTTGDAGPVLIDTTSTESRNRALLARIAEIAGATPPHALINTHHHGDHTYGNWLLPSTTPIIGHVHCRTDVLAAGFLAAELFTGPDYGHQEIRPPDVTFTARMTLHLGDRPVELLHVGPAHTRSDVVVWFPDDRVVFCGDLVFNGGQPFLLEGSVTGYPQALDAIRALDAETLVPGHGPPCRGTDQVRRALDDMAAYAGFVDRLARDGYAAGLPPLTVIRDTELGPFASWREGERLVGNLHRAYHELAGNSPGTPMSLLAAVQDMVEFNGGPISCHA